MNATKKLAAASLFFIAVSIFSITALVKEKPRVRPNNPQTSGLVLYYGNGCSHCKTVEDFLVKNDPSNKLNIVQKEIWSNQANSDELVAKATVCKLDMKNLGVPMLWDAKNSICYEGEQPIVDFLNGQIGKPN